MIRLLLRIFVDGKIRPLSNILRACTVFLRYFMYGPRVGPMPILGLHRLHGPFEQVSFTLG